MKKHVIWLVILALLLTTAVAIAATEVEGETATAVGMGSISADSQGLGSITTFFNSDNQFAGNMFDIQNIGTDPITITSFDINLATGGSGALISVFSVPGTYVGNESNPAPWTLMGTDTVNSNGTNIPTPVAVGGLTINPGESYGLYLTVTNYPAATMRYTNGANVIANTEVQLTLGVGKGDPDFLGSTFSPRSWNGTIYYDIGAGLPTIELEKSPDFQDVLLGGTADFTITVTNTGTVTLTNVTVLDPAVPSCDNSLGTMVAGAATSYACSQPNVMSSFTNTATVTSTYNNEPGPVFTDTAFVNVIDASLDIEKAPDLQIVPSGGTANFTMTVTNTGTSTLVNVTVTDAMVPACDMVIASLSPGASNTYNCSDVGVTMAYTNTAVVTGTVDQGLPQPSAMDTAYVALPPTAVSLTNFGETAAALSPLWLAVVLGIVMGFGLLIRRRLQS
jgi:uncharacterized repeat protein (TIGR01451 family)